MLTLLFMLIAFVASVGFTVLIGAGILTYVRRTWQLIRADGEGSHQTQILDALDQVQTQLYSMSERFERLERQLGEGDSTPPAIPPANDL